MKSILVGFLLLLQGSELCKCAEIGTDSSGSGENSSSGISCRNDSALEPLRPVELASGSGYSNILDVDECSEGSSHCVSESACVNTPDSYNCVCPEGYSGDGRRDGEGCHDVDECVEPVAHCVTGASCVNSIGNYSCNCPVGYSGDGRLYGEGCRDIDECNGFHDCLAGATCINGDGSYTCGCPSGYTGDGRWPPNGQGCIDIDECAERLSNCITEALCVNTGGSYYCSCPTGYIGDGQLTGVGCVDINECAINRVNSLFGYNDCIIGAVCTNTIGSYNCGCPDGYVGDGRWFNGGCNDINECVTGMHNCVPHETCFNTQGSFRCDYTPNSDAQYLKFLNVFADDGELLQHVEPFSWSRATSPVYVDGGIPIGNRIESTVYISTNGLISFGEVWPFRYPSLFPISSYYWLGDISGIVAPFWNYADIQREGDVVYKVYSVGANEKSDELLDQVSRFVSANDQRAANFSGTWMLVVDWNSIPPAHQYYYHYYLSYYYNYNNYYWYHNYYYYSYYRYYRDYYSERLEFYSKRNTFQAIIITDNTETYTVFVYNCDLLQWTGYWRHASIGYSISTTDSTSSTDYDQFVNHPLSLRSSIRDMACQNMADGIPWSNIVYKIGESRTTIQQLRALCKRLYREDLRLFPNLDRLQDSLLPCPCSVFQVWWDRRYRFYTYSYRYSERRGCYIQRFPSRHRASQLCCYSYEWNTFGALIGEDVDRSIGSSMLRYHPRRYPSQYDTYDKNFRDICCGAADLCRLFYSRRPADDCSTYRPPRWTWGRGDPHITSLDGRQYTFNGWGEYTLISLNGSDFVLQCRTEPVVNSTATRFAGFAFGVQNDSVVEVTSDVDSGEMRLLYNGGDIQSNLTSINDTYSGNTVDITKTDSATISSAFSNGLAVTVSVSLMSMLSIVVNVPVEYDSQTQGLMGNFNGNNTDDFIFPNGSMLDDGATDRMIHSFGQAWEISAQKSLFTYPEGLSADNFSHPDHLPDFLDEILANADPQVRELCKGNAECIFDVTQTGSEEVGMATLQFDSDTRQNQIEATNDPPRMIGPATFMVTFEVQSEYAFNVTDTNDFNISVDGNEELEGLLIQDGDIFTFIWNLTEFENTTLTFIATDNLGAMAFLQPQLLICPCANNGRCTTGGLLDTATNPLLMNCLCNPAWSGRFCEEDADGCLQSPCAAGVNCTDVPAPDTGALCGPCPPGFSGDGLECVDIDECSLGTTDCEQECVNTEGNYTCQCFPNYRLVNATHCEDVDECSVLNGGCHQQCINSPGSYHCSCNEGYHLQLDNSTCEVIPAYSCSMMNNCDQECVRLDGVEYCSCSGGYQLADDGLTCIDTNECELGQLACTQICNNTEGGYSCHCFPGYSLGEDGRSCNDVDECVVAALEQRAICPHSAYCENTPGHYECTCPGDTLLRDGECIQPMADTTTPAQTTAAVEPNSVPVPVAPMLSTILYIVIAIISAGSILVGLIVIMATLKCIYKKCFKKKSKTTRVEPMVIQNEQHEMAILDVDRD